MAMQTVNTAQIYYKYASSSTVYSGDTISNPSTVYILDNKATITKSINRTTANVGDTVTYTLAVKNMGVDTIVNMIVKDTLPTGLAFNQGSLLFNGAVFGSGDITLGVTIPTLSSLSVATLIFTASVTNTAMSTLINVANGDYNVLAGGNTIPISIKSNGTTLSVTNMSISFTKFQSKSQMNVGDTGVYSFIISNSGNVSVSNILIQDTVPEGLSFIPGTLRVNGVLTPGTPSSGIFFGSLSPNEGILASYGFTAVSTPNGSSITNTARLNYQYLDSVNNIIQTYQDSNMTTLTLNNLQIYALQSATKQDVKVNDIVTYTVNVRNLGTIDINNVLAYTTIPIFSLGYIPNSLVIDGVSVPDQNIITGVSLPDLLSNGITTVSLSVQVLNDMVKDILTVFQIYYDATTVTNPYSISTQSTLPGYGYVTNTNQWNLYVLNPNLEVNKTSNMSVVQNGDDVIYTITLKNTGSDILSNLVFYDTLPFQMTFISAMYNTSTTSIPISNPAYGITIPGTIGINEVATITIKAKGTIIT